MIGEKERYHGVMLHRILRGSEGVAVTLEMMNGFGGLSYLVNDSTPLYVKYSTSRTTPWAFTFTPEQRDNVIELDRAYQMVWLAFVCGNEGVLAVKWDWADENLIKVTDNGSFSLTITRRRSHQFRISGAGAVGGPIPVAESTFPRDIIASSLRNATWE